MLAQIVQKSQVHLHKPFTYKTKWRICWEDAYRPPAWRVTLLLHQVDKVFEVEFRSSATVLSSQI